MFTGVEGQGLVNLMGGGRKAGRAQCHTEHLGFPKVHVDGSEEASGNS